MFAPPLTRPPFFTRPVELLWTADDLPRHPINPQPRSSPPFYTESAVPLRRRLKRSRPRPQRSSKGKPTRVIPLPVPPSLLPHLSSPSFLPQLSAVIHEAAAPTQAALQELFASLVPPSASANPSRHAQSLLLRLLLSCVLFLDVSGKGKEDMDFIVQCCARVSGLFVIEISGRAQVKDGAPASSPGKGKAEGRERGAKTPSALEAVAEYRNAAMSAALPLSMQHNASTLYHLSLDGVQLDWSALIAQLPGLPRLHHLRLAHCAIDDDAGRRILGALTTSPVTHVQLTNNRLTDAVIPALCRLLSCQNQRREALLWQLGLRTRTAAARKGPLVEGRRAGGRTDSIRMQGLVSVDVSGNDITDAGLLELLPALRDDCWLLALSLHHNRLTARSIAPFLELLTHNRSLLHFSLLPSNAAEPSSSIAALSSIVDPHLATRSAQLCVHHAHQLLMQPQLVIQDRSSARFSHGMRMTGRPVTPSVDSSRTVTAVESAFVIPWSQQLECAVSVAGPLSPRTPRPKSASAHERTTPRPTAERALSPRRSPTSPKTDAANNGAARPRTTTVVVKETASPRAQRPALPGKTNKGSPHSERAEAPANVGPRQARISDLVHSGECVDGLLTHGPTGTQQPPQPPRTERKAVVVDDDQAEETREARANSERILADVPLPIEAARKQDVLASVTPLRLPLSLGSLPITGQPATSKGSVAREVEEEKEVEESLSESLASSPRKRVVFASSSLPAGSDDESGNEWHSPRAPPDDSATPRVLDISELE